MRSLRLPVAVLFGVAFVLFSSVTSGQSYPARPIRILTTEAGGGSDFISRLLAANISGPLGQQVVVENRAAIIAVDTVMKSSPDGYSLLLYGNVVWLDPLMRDAPRWDAFRDFTPIILTNRAPNVLVAHPSVPAGSVKEVIALAKAKSGQLNYGSGASGASTHLAAELFKSMAGVNITRVPYKSSGAVINALIGGEVQIMFATVGSAVGLIKSAKLKALGVTTKEPSALLPGVATVAADLPGYESEANYAIFGPAKTPPAAVRLINQEVMRVLGRADTRDKLLNIGIETLGGTPADLTAKMKSEVAKMGKVIKDAGIKAE